MDHEQDFDGTPSHPEQPPEIPSPGTPTFLPALISYIQHSASANTSTTALPHGHPSLNGNAFPLDPVVFQSILLCLVANKNLILRTNDEDIPNVVKLATLALSVVFAYHPVHRLRIRPKSSSNASSQAASLLNPDPFLRSVFLPSTRRTTDHLSSSSNNATPIRRVDSLQSPLRHSHSGSVYTSQDEGSPSTIHAEKSSWHRKRRSKASTKSHHAASTQHIRASYPSDLAMLGVNNADGGSPGGIHSIYPSRDRDFSPPPQSPPPSVRQISFVSTSTNHKHAPTSPQLPHTQSDQMPFPSHHADSTQPSENPVVPKAIVISGLEHASALSQRAMVRVLAEKRLVLDGGDVDGSEGQGEHGDELDGVWTLPDNFIVVYVCPNDPHERPGIHHSLLDKFAMSTTITLHPAIKSAVRAYRSHNSSNHATSFRSSPSLGSVPLPILAPRPMYPGSPPSFQSPHARNPSPIRPPLTPLIRPSSTPFMVDTDPPPGLLPETLLPTLRSMYASSTHIQVSPHLLLYTADLLSAVRHHPQFDGTLLTARAHADTLDLCRVARLLGFDLTGMEIIKMRVEEESAAMANGRHRSGSGTVDGTTTEYGEGMSEVYSGISSGMGLLSPFGEAQSRPSYDRPSILTQSAISLREGRLPTDPESLDVSEADIARIVPRVVSHRVRIRDGPEDEVLASMVFGALAAKAPKGLRNTVKDVMISILAEV